MPDSQFDGLNAKLVVHRVKPAYAHDPCPSVPRRAAVLIHGRTAYGPAVFDLQAATPEGGDLSVQRALARAGIDTFAPDLLGYGESTRFDNGLDDPGNASLPGVNPRTGNCDFSAGCDRTHVQVFPLQQQVDKLFKNPLGEQLRPHSSSVRFATPDVFVRDIRQVIDDAIKKAHPSDGKVTLVGYSAGGMFVGRTLDPANPNVLLPNSADYIAKVNRVVFLSSLFNAPATEPPASVLASFPLHVYDATDLATTWKMLPDRDAACTGHVVPGSPQQLWTQITERDPVGREWGGDVLGQPTGLARSPVFSSFGWGPAAASRLTPPTLIIHGAEDQVFPVTNGSDIYTNLPGTMTNKVLVTVSCASHGLLFEGCSGPRCVPPPGQTPYGGTAGAPWAGPHSTFTAALIEWITNHTFNTHPSGQFTVDESGVAP
jgi:pimeloyl-ACP methyl ester carboxylesterase